MRSVRLIFDPPAAGAWNMAVDEALLESAAERGAATLRFYQWNEPTLSLGYFQAAADRELHTASRACPLVRRASGGGAIIHDRELTYSIALPLRDVRTKAATELYDACHETLVAALAEFGVAAALHQPSSTACTADGKGRGADQPFLCFLRRSCGDIVCGAVKIVGSAQRRRRGAVLQHGSILLDQSRCAPELPGIAQLSGSAVEPNELAGGWAKRLEKRLGVRLDPGTRSAEEETAAANLAEARFAAAEYTTRR